MSNKEKIINKILKCKSLGQSDNPNEAESALKMMEKLMRTYNITEQDLKPYDTSSMVDVLVYEVNRMWESVIVNKFADEYGCAAYRCIYEDGTSNMYLYGEKDLVTSLAKDIREFREDLLELTEEGVKEHVTEKCGISAPDMRSLVKLCIANFKAKDDSKNLENNDEIDEETKAKMLAEAEEAEAIRKAEEEEWKRRQEEKRNIQIDSYRLGYFNGLWYNSHRDCNYTRKKPTQDNQSLPSPEEDALYANQEELTFAPTVCNQQSSEIMGFGSDKNEALEKLISTKDVHKDTLNTYIDQEIYNEGFIEGRKQTIIW